MTSPAPEVVTTDAGLFALQPAWEALWRRLPAATPFQHPAWQLSWWRCFGTGRPVATCMFEADRLTGLLPLYLLDEGGACKLLPIGIGLSDYLDVLLEPGAPSDAANALLAAALQTATLFGATTCDLTDLPPGARLREITAPDGWHAEWRQTDTCPVLEFSRDATNLSAGVPSKQRRKLRMNRHRSDRFGGWRLHRADQPALKSILERLLRLNQKRWQALDSTVLAFYRAVACPLFKAGQFRLHSLNIGEKRAACAWTMPVRNDRLLFYIGGFDPEFAWISPGTLLLGALIEEGLNEGQRQFHFLRGAEPYKYAWGSIDRHNAACRLVRTC
jgi:CelD/BcsL family acetyltransferase involved in cellulose biosynthesis